MKKEILDENCIDVGHGDRDPDFRDYTPETIDISVTKKELGVKKYE